MDEVVTQSFLSSFLEDKKGNYWFGSNYSGIFQINKTTGSKKNDPIYDFHPIRHKEDLRVDYLFQDSLGTVYFTNPRSIYKWDKDRFTAVYKFRDYDNKSRYYYNQKLDILYFLNKNRLYSYSVKEKRLNWQKLISGVKAINNIKLLSDGALYISTDNGLLIVNQEGDIKSRYFVGKKITDALIDVEGNLWVSTLYNGVFLLINRDMVYYNTDAKYSILLKQDTLFFGGEAMQLHYFANGKLNKYPTKVDDIEYTTHQDKVQCLVEGPSNNIWLGTNSGIYSIQAGTARLFNSIGTNDLVFDKKRLYQASQYGILQFDTNEIELELKRTRLDSSFRKSQTQNFILLNNKISKQRTLSFTHESGKKCLLGKV